MSGAFQDLVHDATQQVIDDDLKCLLSDCLHFLLSTQFVKSTAPCLKDRLWMVRQGSGMGLKHSGDLADCALLLKAEVSWAVNPGVMQEHGIKAYWRFRDDVLLIATEPSLTMQYVRHLMHLAGYFRVVCERVSRERIIFLDVEVWREGSNFHCAPAWKTSSLGIPICESSAHPRHVHVSWPTSLVKGLGIRSTRQQHADKAKLILLQRFKAHLASPTIINIVAGTPTWSESRPHSALNDQMCKWLVLGYHPCLRSPLLNVFYKFVEDSYWSSLCRLAFNKSPPKFRIAWRNDLPNLCTLVRKSL